MTQTGMTYQRNHRGHHKFFTLKTPPVWGFRHLINMMKCDDFTTESAHNIEKYIRRHERDLHEQLFFKKLNITE